MKKLLFAIFILAMLAPLAGAQTVTTMHNQAQATIAWDAVHPIASDGRVVYQLYLKSDPTAATGTKFGSEFEATLQLMSFAPYVTYYFGVQAIYYAAGASTATDSSGIAWSTNPDDCSPDGTFGVLYQPGLQKPKNMLLR